MPQQNGFSADALPIRSFDGQRHIQQRGAGGRGGDHVLFRLQRQQVHAGNGSDIRPLQPAAETPA